MPPFIREYASGDEKVGDVEAIPTVVPNTRTTTNTANNRCYTGIVAYITGSMNIRRDASVHSEKVDVATAGQSVTVRSSKRSGDYCWLQTSKGWIAKTKRVSSTKPTVVRTSQTATCSGTPRNKRVWANGNQEGV